MAWRTLRNMHGKQGMEMKENKCSTCQQTFEQYTDLALHVVAGCEIQEQQRNKTQDVAEFFDWFVEATKKNPPKSEDVYPRNRYSGD
jgi:hypothetical protein